MGRSARFMTRRTGWKAKRVREGSKREAARSERLDTWNSFIEGVYSRREILFRSPNSLSGPADASESGVACRESPSLQVYSLHKLTKHDVAHYRLFTRAAFSDCLSNDEDPFSVRFGHLSGMGFMRRYDRTCPISGWRVFYSNALRLRDGERFFLR